jgi:competence protein ComFC
MRSFLKNGSRRSEEAEKRAILAKNPPPHVGGYPASSFVEPLRAWLNAGLSFLYPEICQICDNQRATPAQGFICSSCRAQVRWVQPPFCQRCGLPFEGVITTAFDCPNCREEEPQFCWARAAVAARDPILEVIHRYKYQRALWFEPFLAELLIQAAAPQLAAQEWDFVVPVPLHPTKQREREFNQAERLANLLSAATQIPSNARLVRRVVATRTQTQLTRDERRTNVRRAFALAPGARLNGERIILVDDVFTTGATTSACAGALRHAGASEVCVWTAARGI